MSDLTPEAAYDDSQELDVLLQHYGWASLTAVNKPQKEEWIFCYGTEWEEDEDSLDRRPS